TYQVRLVDSQGEENPGKEGGRIEIHGTPGINLMAGYWEDPQATRRVLSEDGWLRTDDYALQDRDGWYYFLGRDSDLIKRGGENVSAAEVENVLMQCPGVQQAAVIGVPDSIRDQAIKAFVVLEPGVKYSQEEIVSFAQENLSYYKVPSFVEFRRELPQGNYGKVAKNKLA
ncbi:MAG: AMP-binding protein, partial [Varibaculum cambriense]|nr:AMP-binding protein [Varibaculum cambriense]